MVLKLPKNKNKNVILTSDFSERLEDIVGEIRFSETPKSELIQKLLASGYTLTLAPATENGELVYVAVVLANENKRNKRNKNKDKLTWKS